jgi:hypothetical protein
MDRDRFDVLAKACAASTTRRATLAALLAGLLADPSATDTTARRRRRHRRSTRRQAQPDRKQAKANERENEPPTAPATVPTGCCADRRCAPGPGTNLTTCCYHARNLAGASFRGANATGAHFAGANLRNADFRGANVSHACFVDADIRGARFGGANQQGVIRCRTRTDAGLDNSGCARGTACCRTGLGAPQPCAGCATHCCSGVCCPANATQCNSAGLCCVPNCAGRDCGDDGCGNPDGCGACRDGEDCDEESGQCLSTCTRNCSQDGDCPNVRNCVCNQAQGVCCTRSCDGKICGPDGCGGRCGEGCPDGTVCSADGTACLCTPQTCCTGQSYCTDPLSPATICADPSGGQACLCVVSRAGQPFCAGEAVGIPNGCATDADCRNFDPGLAGAVCVNGVPGSDFCDGATPFCATPCPV